MACCGNAAGHFLMGMPPLCKGRWPGVSRVGGIDLLQCLRRNPPPPPGTLRWARFLPDEKSGKESPKAGSSPALWNPPRGTGSPCVLLFSALGLVGSHGWRGDSTEHTCFSAKPCFSHQGLTLVSCCFQRSAAWFPAAGTPLLQGRPGCENHLAVGPASQGDLVWWQKQEPQ